MRKKIGVVGVDSGQLVIMDPSYIRTQWEEGNPIGIVFCGEGGKEAAEELKILGYKVTKDVTGAYFVPFADNKPITTDLIEHQVSAKIGKIVMARVKKDSTYEKIFEKTNSTDQAGQLCYKIGHPGFAVAFRSGLGDGVYDVYATYKTLPGWGERITKVEIELITEEDSE